MAMVGDTAEAVVTIGGDTGRVSVLSDGSVHADIWLADVRGHGEALAQVDVLSCRVEAARLDIVVSGMRQGLHIDDGHRDPNSWLRGTLDCSRRTATAVLRRAEFVSAHPQYLEAMRDGRMLVDHIDALTVAHRNPRCGHMLGDFFDQFVDAAKRLAMADFERLVTLWIQRADLDGPTPTADPNDSRSARLKRNADGSLDLYAHLPPAQAAMFREIFSRFLDAETELDRVDARNQGTPGEYLRTSAQRGADALMAMAEQAVAAPPGERAKPLVTIVVDWHTVRDAMGHDTDPGSTPDPDAPGVPPHTAHLASRFCRTRDGDPVHPRDMLAALVWGRVRVLIVDAHGHPFSLGRQGSLFVKSLREAYKLLCPECVWGGCSVHARNLQADHVQPRSEGGATAPDNGVGNCGRHNRWRHAHGYTIVRGDDGRWHTLRPDGSDLLAPRPGRDSA